MRGSLQTGRAVKEARGEGARAGDEAGGCAGWGAGRWNGRAHVHHARYIGGEGAPKRHVGGGRGSHLWEGALDGHPRRGGHRARVHHHRSNSNAQEIKY